MSVEVYIDGLKLDTDVSTKIAETKQINDFFEISARQTSYTNTIKFPKTEKNIAILNGMSVPGNTSLSPYRVHNVSIFRNGIQTVSDGIGFLNDTDTSFNLFVYSENIDLFDSIGGKSIADLNLTFLNHDLGIGTWLSSFSRNDYVYPLADYGKTEGDTVEVNYQIPALFVAFLWNKIFTDNGFSYKYAGRANQSDFNPFIKQEWKELAISIDEGLPVKQESVTAIKKLELSKIKVTEIEGKIINPLGNSIVVQKATGDIVEYMRFLTVFDPDSLHVITNAAQLNRSRIRVKEDGFYKIAVTGVFFNLETDSAAMFIEKGGVDLFTLSDNLPELQSSFGFSNKVWLRANEELLFKVVSKPKDGRSFYSYDINIVFELDNSVNNINFSSYLSKIKQKDFLKDVMHHYGLMFRRIGKIYEFIAFDEILDPTASYSNPQLIKPEDIFIDWSNKFQRLTKESTNLGMYARRNLFKYRYANPDDNYADGSITIDDQTLDDEITLIERLYRAPDSSSLRINNQILRSCPFYEKELNDDGSIKSIKQIKGEPYFFKVVKQQMSLKYKLAGSSGNSVFLGNVPVASFDDLDFNNIIATRYSALANTLNYGRKISAVMKLNELDVNRLDFFKLIYLKQEGKLFYINKLPNFTGDEFTSIDLLQVRSIEKLGEFSDDFGDDFNN